MQRKLKEEETVVARLGILDQQVSEAMRRAEGALKEEELHPILKVSESHKHQHQQHHQ